MNPSQWVDTNSVEFQIGQKIGHAVMTYFGVRLMLKGFKLALKSTKAIVNTPIK